MNGFVLWFTGLSGSGKSTLTSMVTAELRRRGVHVEALDGDEVRRMLSKGLGFSKEDRDANVRRIGYVARMVARSGACVIAAAISPYRDVRDEIRRASEHFVEVYCECPLDTLAERDPKGLYKKALAGEIKNFTGVDDPYEAPDSPEVRCRTDIETPEESARKIVRHLESLALVPRDETRSIGARSRDRLSRPHGGELMDRVLRGAFYDAALDRAPGLESVVVDERTFIDAKNVASGTFSPLVGFMTSRDHRRVVHEQRLERGLPWPIPVTLPIPAAVAERLVPGNEIGLKRSGGGLAAVLEVTDVWVPDRTAECEAVFGSVDGEWARRLLDGPARYVGGELHWLERERAEDGPAATRDAIAKLGWRGVVAYETAHAPTRADEYACKCALELCDGLVVLLRSGPGDGSALSPDVRESAWRRLVDRHFPPGRVVIAPWRHATRPAPGRELLLRALVAKNHGASRFLSITPGEGDDRTSATSMPFAHGEIGIAVSIMPQPGFSAERREMGTSKTLPGSRLVSMTGAELDRRLARGERPDETLVRAVVLEVIAS